MSNQPFTKSFYVYSQTQQRHTDVQLGQVRPEGERRAPAEGSCVKDSESRWQKQQYWDNVGPRPVARMIDDARR